MGCDAAGMSLDYSAQREHSALMITAEVRAEQLAELVKQVQAGNEVVLTLDSKPVAKLVPASPTALDQNRSIQIESIKGRRVLTPIIRQEDLADEMFSRE
jgi:prevent-host-death family protein